MPTVDYTNCTACCGGGPVSTGCCSTHDIPATINAHITATTSCLCAGAGTDISLTYNSSTQKWEGSGLVGTCGKTLNLKFYCNGGGSSASDFRLDYSWDDVCGPTTTGVSPAGTPACNPLDVLFVPIDADTCCGTINSEVSVQITE